MRRLEAGNRPEVGVRFREISCSLRAWRLELGQIYNIPRASLALTLSRSSLAIREKFLWREDRLYIFIENLVPFEWDADFGWKRERSNKGFVYSGVEQTTLVWEAFSDINSWWRSSILCCSPPRPSWNDGENSLTSIHKFIPSADTSKTQSGKVSA